MSSCKPRVSVSRKSSRRVGGGPTAAPHARQVAVVIVIFFFFRVRASRLGQRSWRMATLFLPAAAACSPPTPLLDPATLGTIVLVWTAITGMDRAFFLASTSHTPTDIKLRFQLSNFYLRGTSTDTESYAVLRGDETWVYPLGNTAGFARPSFRSSYS